MFRHRTRRADLWAPEYGEAILIAIPGALIGARLGWAIPVWLNGYIPAPGHLDSLNLIHVSFFGGLFGGAVLGLGWLAIRRTSLAPAGGMAAEAMLVGLAVARLGSLFIAEHLGKRTGSPFGFTIPSGRFAVRGECFEPGDTCHQTALYELLSILALLVAAHLWRRRRASEPAIASAMLVGYGLIRFIAVEPFRTTFRVLGLTGSQWASILLAAGGILLIVRARRGTEFDMGRRGPAPKPRLPR